MADQTNPYVTAGMAGMMLPNPYTAFKGAPLPMPGYMGTPTDAQGNPIRSYLDAQSQHDAWNAANPAPAAPAQGTTLNSTPPGVIPFQHATMSDGMPYGQTNLGRGVTGTSWQGPGGGTPSQQPQAAPAAAAPTNPFDMRQAYLTALSNPGKVTTPGANVPQAAPLGQPSVMNSFLAANPSGGSAAPAGGGYGNQDFFNTLNKLRSA